MRISRLKQIPEQAWLLDCAQSLLVCGNSVEVRGNSFFEGAWDGDFSTFHFAECANVFGSGGKKVEKGWMLVPPSHTLEAIYLFHANNGTWYASNSLAFLQHCTTMDLSRISSSMIGPFIQIINGVGTSPNRLDTPTGRLHILHYHKALITNGEMRVTPRTSTPNFEGYNGYLRLLQKVMDGVAENCASHQRRRRYELLASVSSGYDSPACASIAKASGCREAVTFTTARGGESDDGTAIGDHLGLAVIPVERSSSLGTDADTAAAFYATGMQALDLVFQDLPLAGRAFVTGFHGDKVWSRHGAANVVLARGDLSGSSLGEFRLIRGFIHIPLPFVGARDHPRIRQISNSPEMAPYSIRGHYDRPVPRRIAEESGVPRQLFGWTKKAVVSVVFSNPGLLSPAIRFEVESRIEGRARRAYRFRAARYRSRMAMHRASYSLVQSLPVGRSTALRAINGILLMGRPWSNFEHSHPFNAIAFSWAISLAANRYRAAGTF